MRKIVQICTYAQPSCRDWSGFTNVTALCDDGTVWEIYHQGSPTAQWQQLPAIPQDEGNDE